MSRSRTPGECHGGSGRAPPSGMATSATASRCSQPPSRAASAGTKKELSQAPISTARAPQGTAL
eukprot:13834682-Heterocapsa_arctica.AAC.1